MRTLVANLVARRRPRANAHIGAMRARRTVAATPSSACWMARVGLHALRKHPAMELAPKQIRVNALSPAVAQTPICEGFMPEAEVASALQGFNAFHPIGRVGTPQPGICTGALRVATPMVFSSWTCPCS
jgi:NAD(P)-dependent dehydrogenase (short-subunit alcohol dehydrogenase family)